MTSPSDKKRVFDIHDFYSNSFEFYEDYEIFSEYDRYRALKAKLERPFDNPDVVGIVFQFISKNLRTRLI